MSEHTPGPRIDFVQPDGLTYESLTYLGRGVWASVDSPTEPEDIGAVLRDFEAYIIEGRKYCAKCRALISSPSLAPGEPERCAACGDPA